MVAAIADVASTYARVRIDTASFALFRAVAEEDAIGEGTICGFYYAGWQSPDWG
jgi:hypothetical protein